MWKFCCSQSPLTGEMKAAQGSSMRGFGVAPGLLVFSVCLAPIVAAAEARAQAQQFYSVNQNYTNHYGLDLPAVPIPNGQDEVRAADGTTCKSTVASNGAYFDGGVIGSNASGDYNAGGVYGRVVVPLGQRPSRIDCRRLYELEIERMQIELQLTKMGLGNSRPGAARATIPEAQTELGAAERQAATLDSARLPPPRPKKNMPWVTEVVASNTRAEAVMP